MGTAKIVGFTAIPWLFDKAAIYLNVFRPLTNLEVSSLTVLVFALFLLWTIGRRAQQIEEPKLELAAVNQASYHLQISAGIKNKAKIAIDGVEVEFIEIRSRDGVFYRPINEVISMDRFNTIGRFTINGDCEKHFSIGRYMRYQAKEYTDENRVLECKLDIVHSNEKPVLIDREHILTFRISGATSPAIMRSLLVDVDEENRPVFKVMEESK